MSPVPTPIAPLHCKYRQLPHRGLYTGWDDLPAVTAVDGNHLHGAWRPAWATVSPERQSECDEEVVPDSRCALLPWNRGGPDSRRSRTSPQLRGRPAATRSLPPSGALQLVREAGTLASVTGRHSPTSGVTPMPEAWCAGARTSTSSSPDGPLQHRDDKPIPSSL